MQSILITSSLNVILSFHHFRGEIRKAEFLSEQLVAIAKDRPTKIEARWKRALILSAYEDRTRVTFSIYYCFFVFY